MTTTYTISQAAMRSGLSAKMIRDYESKGLLAPALRSESGYRLYKHNDIQTLQFIARARELGFSLHQLQELLDLWHNQHRNSSQVKALAENHIAALERKAHQLHEMADVLRALAQQCQGNDQPDCPILRGLEKPLNTAEIKQS